ncbi:MAG: hypothetical protein Terrestrivirus4_31 [Terrestrivirus sp.]|uniref:Uncharacterized protein n=1 Tax=Terrestrivirus sp. TaxID=2487775 RepID=A0A3G4ZQV1_9VIRU|nr:MAG: hypothetical protein Terrestrivirus4_31 [Terrestrivirus sp.]
MAEYKYCLKINYINGSIITTNTFTTNSLYDLTKITREFMVNSSSNPIHFGGYNMRGSLILEREGIKSIEIIHKGTVGFFGRLFDKFF